MQRRDSLRLAISPALPCSCFIRPIDALSESRFAIVDIGYGGLGLLGFSPDLDLQAGQILRGCRIELAHFGIFHCDLSIGSQSELILKNGIKTIRTGAQFTHLNSQAKNLLQRFIFSLETQQNL
ncbi:hypothetical protein NT239_12110 [Chitinibacter sp. SCUT-21]|uniref:hypothetical protein n=1 Tax=Chitinibacter sp. SCUT-21 TaxID=2970891 RepID=UPI0035A727F2